MRIAITGASGFIGTALLRAIAPTVHDPLILQRNQLQNPAELAKILAGSDVMIHLAGLAHRTGAGAPDRAAFDEVNVKLAERVYVATRTAGVHRFIHLSTIAVLSRHAGLLTTDLPVVPTTAYDQSKAAAEIALQMRAADGGPKLVIVRPPLVYGPGAKANLRMLLRLCDTPVPLPFGAVANCRSMVGVSNLADALLFLATMEAAPPPIVHVTDGEDLSLVDLVRTIRQGLGRPPRLWAIPPALLRAALRAAGRSRMASQLLDDQCIDDSVMRRLGWTPPNSSEVDLLAMARAYAAERVS